MKRVFLMLCAGLLCGTSTVLLDYFIVREKLLMVIGIALLAGVIAMVLCIRLDALKNSNKKVKVSEFVAETSLFMFYFLGIAYFLLDLFPSARHFLLKL